MGQYIKVVIENNIAILEIDRPEASNALNSKLVYELLEKAKELDKDDSIKVIIIIGNKNFAAGADIKNMANLNSTEAKGFMFTKAFDQLENLSVPTIAAINGYALGGGFELALACDFRIASRNAIFAFPEINLGIFPGAGGALRLPRIIGESKAKELIYLGGRISAEEALRYGLLYKVTDDAKLRVSAMELGNKLSKKSKLALGAAKRVINYGIKINDKANEIESYEWSNLFNYNDQKEGMNAFIEKRKPVFK